MAHPVLNSDPLLTYLLWEIVLLAPILHPPWICSLSLWCFNLSYEKGKWYSCAHSHSAPSLGSVMWLTLSKWTWMDLSEQRFEKCFFCTWLRGTVWIFWISDMPSANSHLHLRNVKKFKFLSLLGQQEFSRVFYGLLCPDTHILFSCFHTTAAGE